MCEESSALTQAFFVASLRANTSWTNGSGRDAGSSQLGAIADNHFDPRLLAAVEHVRDQGRGAERVARNRRTQEPHLSEIAVGVPADPMEAAVDRQPHLATVGLFRRNKTCCVL